MSRRKKYTIEEVKEYCSVNDGECITKIYTNNKQKLDIRCGKCGHIWHPTFKDIKVGGKWCPKCAGNIRSSLENACQIAALRNGKCLSKSYKNNKTNLTWKCNKCSCVWDARLDRIKSGTWCPKCKRSHGERIIASLLDRKGLSYREEYILREAGNKRIDFYVEDLNLAIEFDGVQHFQVYKKYTPDEKTLEKIKKYDREKVEYCMSKDIRILRISYDTTNILGVLDYALRSDIPLLVTGYDKYSHILENIDSDKFRVLLNGGW